MPVSVFQSTKTSNNNSNNLLHPCLATFKEGCKFGDKCRFAHLPRNICLEFVKKGSCSRGSTCRFSHQTGKTTSTVANNHDNKRIHSSRDVEVNDATLFPDLLGTGSSSGVSNIRASAAVTVAVAKNDNKKKDCESASKTTSTGVFRDSATETCDLFPPNSELLPRDAPPGFAYKLFTIASRADCATKAADAATAEIARLAAACDRLESENAELQIACDASEADVRARLEAECAERILMETEREAALKARAKCVSDFAALDKAQTKAVHDKIKELIGGDLASKKSSSTHNIEELAASIAQQMDFVLKEIGESKQQFNAARAETKKNKKTAMAMMLNGVVEENRSDRNGNDE